MWAALTRDALRDQTSFLFVSLQGWALTGPTVDTPKKKSFGDEGAEVGLRLLKR